jgi:hypothetical protein
MGELSVKSPSHRPHPADVHNAKQAVETQLHTSLPSLRRFLRQVRVRLDSCSASAAGRHRNDKSAHRTANKQALLHLERQKIGARRFSSRRPVGESFAPPIERAPLISEQLVAQRRSGR